MELLTVELAVGSRCPWFQYRAMLPMLATLDCCNKMPQTVWLKQQTFISYISVGWEVQYQVWAN